MNEAISNIWRRPLRAALTILGIVIGVFALTVMGALAEKLNVLVDGGDEYFRTRIFVFDQGAASGFQASARPITRDLVDQMSGIAGVDRATPVLQTLLDPDEVGGFDIPELLTGIEPETWYDDRVDLRVDAGRFLEADDVDVTVIGADLAERYGLRVGDTFTMRERDFEVIGVLERTLTFPDKIAYVPLRNAQEIYVESVPEAFQERTDELATQIEVFPTDLADADAIAAAIEETVEGVRTVTP
jgi:putative ABC transport system permease protein